MITQFGESLGLLLQTFIALLVLIVIAGVLVSIGLRSATRGVRFLLGGLLKEVNTAAGRINILVIVVVFVAILCTPALRHASEFFRSITGGSGEGAIRLLPSIADGPVLVAIVGLLSVIAVGILERRS